MSFLDDIRVSRALKREQDEEFYALAAREVESGKIRPGLWAKALAEAQGKEKQAKAIYIRSLVQRLRDEALVVEQQEARDRDAVWRTFLREQRYERMNAIQQEQKREALPERANDSSPGPKGGTIALVLLLAAGAIVVLAWHEKNNKSSSAEPLNNSQHYPADVRENYNTMSIPSTQNGVVYSNSQRRQEAQTDEKFPDCELKGIMTDEDYYKCGLSPPPVGS